MTIALASPETQQPSPDLVVTVDGIYVGTLPTADFKAIQRDTYRDWRLAISQAANLLSSLGRVLMWGAVAMCTLCVMGALAAALTEPEAVAAGLRAAAVATPEDVQRVAWVVAFYGSTLVTIFLWYSVVFESSFFGFRDCYSELIRARVRQRLGIVGGGELRLQDANEKHEF